MTSRHVLFDLDGTLIDSASGILATLDETLRRHGVRPLVPSSPSLIGPPLRQLLEKVSGMQDATALDAMAATFRDVYEAVGIPMTAPFSGSEALLETLIASGITLHLTTNKRRAPTHTLLTALDWTRHFSTVYAPEGTETPPLLKPELLRRQLAAASIAPGAAVYVGDTREDGHAAAANGLAFIAVGWGYGGLTMDEIGRHRWTQVSSIEELATTLALTPGEGPRSARRGSAS